MQNKASKSFKFIFYFILAGLIILFQLNFLNQVPYFKNLNLILVGLIFLIFIKIKHTWFYFLLVGLILDLILPLNDGFLLIYFGIIWLVNIFLIQKIIIANQVVSLFLLLCIDIVFYYIYLWLGFYVLNLFWSTTSSFVFSWQILKEILQHILINSIFLILIYFIFKNKIDQLHEGSKPFYTTIG
ncbi:MAG: hypothetical protein PHS07_00550 [Patescibacteria group bacterium]|nr:hypothetical protein [Patescibacteria group bacterium]